ncbi:MAG: hypothetical protein K0R34_1986 [Herbinix sp.]|jgi:hypothetical protein|nr:hypothetical protein [Herbinix sp.]
MKLEQKLDYQNIEFNILAVEQEYIVHPIALGYIPYSSASLQCSFSSRFTIKDYRLLLCEIEVGSNEAMNFGGARIEDNLQKHSLGEFPVSYNGVILIGANPVKEYYMKGDSPSYFSYQTVIELVFENGVLTTTIDQSKAMLRIRKNLELGLRSLNKKRDKNCISRFMNAIFVGEYKSFRFQYNRMNYIKEMKKDYSAASLIKFNNSIE